MAPPNAAGGTFGAMALAGAKMTLKVALNAMVNNRPIMEHAARAAYEEETGGAWAKLAPENKSLWVARAQAMSKALISTISL